MRTEEAPPKSCALFVAARRCSSVSLNRTDMARRCHDCDPSTQGTRAWYVGREDTTPLSCHTGTQPHTASPAHVGLRITDETRRRPRAKTG